ncbi:MAG: response regulator [Thermodesulfobacteriota bacterium]
MDLKIHPWKSKDEADMNTILIMDEDEAIQMLYADELTEEGYEVVACSNAAGLMDLIGRKTPDLVVMEAFLRNRDGLELLQEISHTYEDLPVVLCTTSPGFKEDLRSLAARGFVVKSSRLRELKAVIKDLLEADGVPHAHPPDPMAQVDIPWNEAW